MLPKPYRRIAASAQADLLEARRLFMVARERELGLKEKAILENALWGIAKKASEYFDKYRSPSFKTIAEVEKAVLRRFGHLPPEVKQQRRFFIGKTRYTPIFHCVARDVAFFKVITMLLGKTVEKRIGTVITPNHAAPTFRIGGGVKVFDPRLLRPVDLDAYLAYHKSKGSSSYKFLERKLKRFKRREDAAGFLNVKVQHLPYDASESFILSNHGASCWKVGDTDKAIALFQDASRNGPAIEILPTLGRAYLKRGKPGDLESAIACLTVATQLNPYDYASYFALAKAHRKNGDEEKALQNEKKAKALIK